ncbi:MAG: aldehyde dehydrogenase family protein, partial [Flavobacteriales bacterium]|nr:aldehyde dehydrogenase family protein [Flavobacteriales bacterium]
KRIVWAKFFNAGQTCIAPDYILVEKKIEQKLLEALKEEIKNNYSNSVSVNENYVQIINERHFQRLTNLIPTDKIYTGGKYNIEERVIHPTILHNINFEDEIMKDEIFGPILPIISFDNLDATIANIKKKDKPLSLYIYSNNKKRIKKLLYEISFGGGAINDSLVHLLNPNLPFGGVGASGIGSYHSKAGFDTFTHYKSILHKSFLFEPNIKYKPYSKLKKKILKLLLE